MADTLAPLPAGVVLAGGLSSRMGGGQKALRPLAGRPMIAHVIARIEPQVGQLAISANAPGYEGFGLPVLADPVAGFPGPLAGLLAGLRWASGLRGTSHLLTVPGDAPFLPLDLAVRLAEAAEPGRPVLARSATGLQPLAGLWPVDLADPLADWLAGGGARKVRIWTEHCGATVRMFDAPGAGPDPFYNVNTPDDLATAEAIALRG